MNSVKKYTLSDIEKAYYHGLEKGYNERSRELMEVKVKYLADIDSIEQVDGSDWIDLRCAKRTVLTQGEFAIIPLGVAMKLPRGFEAHIVPR